MRIIRVILILIALMYVFPKTALADENQESNETKTNLKIQDGGVVNNGFLLKNTNSALLPYDPNNFKNTIVAPDAIDPKREKVLEKYKEQRRLANLPKEKFAINASAYTAAADECGKSDGITASGLMVKENETLACPASFPFGTKIKISGMGTFVCQDRGGAIKGNHIDIYMKTKTQAFAFGRKNLLAEVIN